MTRLSWLAVGVGIVVQLSCGGGGSDPDASSIDGAVVTMDASPADASPADASVADAAIPDAEVPDAEVPDAEVPDAEVPDAEVPDAEVPDAAIPDAAIPDAMGSDALVSDSGITSNDAGKYDAGWFSCNPVTQTGCAPTDKCTWIVDQVDPVLLGYTGCAPDGDKDPGDACTSPEIGYDDCVAGYYCLGGICNQICSTASDSCPDSYSCSSYAGLWLDLDSVGLCRPECDPVIQDCAAAVDACYLQAISGEALCAGVPDLSATQTQDMACYGPDSTSCYLNGCAKGYGANQPDNTCAFFCNPIDNWVGNVNGLAGDPVGITCEATFAGARPDGPGSPYECRYIQSYYSNTDAVAANIGMCLDPNGANGGGSCADFDLTQLISDMNDGTADAADYCDSICPECCMLDCISLATAAAMLPAFRALYDCYVSRPEIRARCELRRVSQ